MSEIRSCLSNARVVYECANCGHSGIFKAEKCARCGNVVTLKDNVPELKLGGKELNLEIDYDEDDVRRMSRNLVNPIFNNESKK